MLLSLLCLIFTYSFYPSRKQTNKQISKQANKQTSKQAVSYLALSGLRKGETCGPKKQNKKKMLFSSGKL